ncbi:16907_t:CDS:2 [Cetraspora pellucida]|uniref:16907_t:CDS:1 n=1 Tax=Cetraspora pellucida TaxID=1433469 RepID=A0A9N9HF94_9GLOM|nr:16907_t:CDS:2 [Cetraspora pellucida]
MSQHQLLQFNKVKTLHFYLQASKILRNLFSNNNEDTLTNLYSPSLQNDSYDESNNDNLDWDNIQYEYKSYNTNLESQDDIKTILTYTNSSSEIFDDTNYLL